MKKLLPMMNVFLMLSVLPAWAGGGAGDGGGGNAVVCRDSQGKITKAELLDLYEGAVRYNYDLTQDSDPLHVINRALDRSPNLYARFQLSEMIQHVLNNHEFLRAGVALNPSADLGKGIGVPVPEGCRLEGVGYYEEDGKLKISRSVYQALSPTDRAAFFLHEAAYALARKSKNQSDSKDSRKYVAAVLSQNVSDGAVRDQLAKIMNIDDTSKIDEVQTCMESHFLSLENGQNPEWQIRAYAPKLGSRDREPSLSVNCTLTEAKGGGQRVLFEKKVEKNEDLLSIANVAVGDCRAVDVRFDSGVWRFRGSSKDQPRYELDFKVRSGGKMLSGRHHSTEDGGPTCDFTGISSRFELSRKMDITFIPDGAEQARKAISGSASDALKENQTNLAE